MSAARRPAGLAALLTLTLAPIAGACLWDADTLWQERQRFPGTLELIVGKFARHSDPFYEHRVADRRSKLRLHDAGETTLTDKRRAALYDDLAVALDKLGRREEALAALDEKAAALPNVGRYETAANRGTVLIHAGRLEAGLAEIERALEINPDAHFGRERIQKLLVDYLIERRGEAGDAPYPLAPPASDRRGFAAFLHEHDVTAEAGRQGVEGMLRFGDYRNPVLLEALGDLLMAEQATSNVPEPDAARLLAARAYLAAGRSAPDAAAAYRELAAAALAMQRIDGKDATVAQVADALDREFAETDEWYKKVEADEALWIESSPDPDARFRQKYGVAVLKVGDLTSRPAHIQEQWSADARHWPLDAAIGVGGALTLAGIWALVAYRRRSPNGWERG